MPIHIDVPASEFFDESKQQFIQVEAASLNLEHSLVSVSKWESKWCKAFLGKQEKTTEETIDYIRCMTLTQNVDPLVYEVIARNRELVDKITTYIKSPMTATIIKENPNEPKSHETITSELIYYWMVSLQIPVEFQKWHLNRLLTLIRVCNVKNKPPKKMTQREIMARNASLNAARKRQLHTKG